MSASASNAAPGILLVVFGIWVLLQTLVGGLVDRILALGAKTSSSGGGSTFSSGPGQPGSSSPGPGTAPGGATGAAGAAGGVNVPPPKPKPTAPGSIPGINAPLFGPGITA